MSEPTEAYLRAFEQFKTERYAQEAQTQPPRLPAKRASAPAEATTSTPINPNGGGELSELSERKLKLQWEDLKAKLGFDGEHLKWHGRQQFLTQHGMKLLYADRISGVRETATLASERFSQVADEYLQTWASTVQPRTEMYEKRLEEVASSVIGELAGVWAVDEWHAAWFERECRSSLESGFRECMKVWKNKACQLEIKSLESPGLGLHDLLNAESNDGIASRRQQCSLVVHRAVVPLPEYEPLPSPLRPVGGGPSLLDYQRPKVPPPVRSDYSVVVPPPKGEPEPVEQQNEYSRPNLAVCKPEPGAESVELAISPEPVGAQEELLASSSAKRFAPDRGVTQTRIPLHVQLKEAENLTQDPKLRKKLMAVLRYNRYLEDLKVLKTACKRYQTPALLEQSFRDLDVWVAMNDDDKADIAKGKFFPGVFAWSLVKRIINLTGGQNRTLKNYRSALRAAGLL